MSEPAKRPLVPDFYSTVCVEHGDLLFYARVGWSVTPFPRPERRPYSPIALDDETWELPEMEFVEIESVTETLGNGRTAEFPSVPWWLVGPIKAQAEAESDWAAEEWMEEQGR